MKTRTTLLWIMFTLARSMCFGQEYISIPPPNVALDNPWILPSDQYKVEIRSGDHPGKVFVYMMFAQHFTNNSLTTSWANIPFAGPCKIRVTPAKTLSGTNYCRIFPSSSGVDPVIQDTYVEFDIREPGYYSVEFEKGIKIDHPLLLFVNEKQELVPDSDDPDVIWFRRGYHDIGERFQLESDQWVYIEEGAYVRGMFYAENARNITISGGGILSGEGYPARTAHHLVGMNDVENLVIDGITMIHAPRFNIRLTGKNHLVRNVKMMGWWFSTDGVSTGRNGLIENCFFKVNDDAIKLYDENTLAKNCVIWQMENGAPFQIGWGGDEDRSGFYAYDCDVIRVEHEWDNENEAVFCAIHGARGMKSNYHFEDIRIENAGWRIFSIVTRPNRWVEWDPERGSLTDIHFKNISFTGDQRIFSIFKGHDVTHKIKNVTIENLVINGKLISTAKEGNIYIDTETTENIRIIKTK